VSHPKRFESSHEILMISYTYIQSLKWCIYVGRTYSWNPELKFAPRMLKPVCFLHSDVCKKPNASLQQSPTSHKSVYYANKWFCKGLGY
jgi:hypothetical protein